MQTESTIDTSEVVDKTRYCNGSRSRPKAYAEDLNRTEPNRDCGLRAAEAAEVFSRTSRIYEVVAAFDRGRVGC